MRGSIRLCGAVTLLATVVGCTSVTVRRVLPNDTETEGLRYWLPAPYLMVAEPIELYRTETFEEGDAAQHALVSFDKLTHDQFNQRLAKAPSPVPAAPGPPPPPPPAALGTGGSAKKSSAGTGAATPLPGATQPSSGDASAILGGGGKDGTKDDEEEEEEPASAAPASAKPEGLGPKVEIVWLPDYCQQYALSQETILASSTNNFTLQDGWKLTQVDTQLDSTEVAESVIGLFTKKLEFEKDIEVAKLGAAEAPAEGEAEGEGDGAEAQAGTLGLVKKTTIVYLEPGLYRLFDYGAEGCTSKTGPTFSLGALKTRESIRYSKPDESAP